MSSTNPVLRCQHIKVDGVQCGSPALRGERRCYFHERWNRADQGATRPHSALRSGILPALEDANSIQLALAEVMRLAIMGHIEHRVFALLLSALRIAVANVKHMSPVPKPTHIVIDPESVENRPLGATAWSEAEGKDYDMIETPDIPQKPASTRSPKPEKVASEWSFSEISAKDEDDPSLDSYERLVAGVARDPDYLDKTPEENEANFKKYKENQANSAPEKIVTRMIPWDEWNQMSDDAKRALESALTP
jgi:hypothetical protein